MFCNQCGNQIPDGSRFCSFCGTNLTAAQSVPRPAPVQADSYFDIRHGVLVKYKGREKNVVVPAGVVEIEKDAFTGYDMESITIPEGCRKVHIDTFVKVIQFPSTIDYFSLRSMDGFGKPADKLFFAPGTRRVCGSTPRYDGSLLKNNEFPMTFHIPSSVMQIDDQSFFHYTWSGDNQYFHSDFFFCDNINACIPEIRRQLYRRSTRCQHCGGDFNWKAFWGPKCNACGKKMDYDFNGIKWVSK